MDWAHHFPYWTAVINNVGIGPYVQYTMPSYVEKGERKKNMVAPLQQLYPTMQSTAKHTHTHRDIDSLISDIY